MVGFAFVEIFNTQLLEFGESSGEIFFPTCPIASVEFNPCNHFRIDEESDIGRQHNDARLCVSHEHFKAVVLFGLVPFHVNKINEIGVVKSQSRCSPWSNKATSVWVTHADSVRT